VPTPLAQALERVGADLPELPAHYDFRGILLEEIRGEWRPLAKEIVKLAKAGNPQTLRLITQFALEGEDDDSAARWWQMVLAGVVVRRAANDEAPEGVAGRVGGRAPDDGAALAE
jgi:hypothetical protein